MILQKPHANLALESILDHPAVHPCPNTGCWFWIGCGHTFGHGLLTIRNKNWAAHRYSWVLAHGQIPDGMDVLHNCNVACCVNPDHLRLGTHADNMADKIRAGTSKRVRYANLTPLHVREIRRLKSMGRKTTDLAAEFNCTIGTIYQIARRATWKDV